MFRAGGGGERSDFRINTQTPVCRFTMHKQAYHGLREPQEEFNKKFCLDD
jgi:hypothetical protein